MSNLEKIILSNMGHLKLSFNNNIEEAIIYTEDVEINGDNYLQTSFIPKDFLCIEKSHTMVGTTLINLLNKSIILNDILNAEQKKYISLPKNYFNISDALYKLKKRISLELTDTEELRILFFSIIHSFTMKFSTEFDAEKLYSKMSEFKKNGLNNYFYDETYKYLLSIEDRRFYTKEHWYNAFSFKEIYQIFILYLLHTINYIKDNIDKNVNIPEHLQKDIVEITSLEDLFYISKYQLAKQKKLIKKCRNCNYYFINESRCTETYCLRIYKDTKKTCRALSNHNSNRNNETLPNIIKKEINSIKALIRKKPFDKKEQLKIFNNLLQSQKFDLAIERRYDEANEKDLKELLNWLQSIHNNIKKNPTYLLKLQE